MTYTIVNTAGTTVATVNEAQLNSIFDVTLIGKNYTNYGQIFNDNMYRLMENFAAPNTSLLSPVQGQLWYNTTTNTLNLYNGTTWNSIAGAALTIKGTKVGINNSDPEFDMDITSTLRSKGAAWINYAGANNSDANQAGLVLGTVGKGVLPTNNAGTISIWSSEGATSRLQAMLSLKTDPTADNRRLAIGVMEQGASWRNITLAELGGSVGIGTTVPGTKLDVRGVSRVSDGTVNSDNSVDGTNAYAGTSSNHPYVLKTNAQNRLFIDATGKTGIGTDTPAYALDVNGVIRGKSDLFLTKGGVPYIGTTDNFGLRIGTNNNENISITTSGNVGINQSAPANKLDIKTADHTTEGVRLLSDAGQWVQMHASLDAGSYNPSVLAGDSAIIYSAGTIDTGRLVIAPWGTTKSGIVLDSTGQFTTSTSGIAQFTGTARGAFALNDINSTLNQWTALDFSNPTVNEIPLARVASYYTSGGTYLSLGTSENYANGITNQALTIDPVGRVGIGTATPAIGYSLTSFSPIYINSQNTDITPTSAWAGQITARGAGYSGGIALDATGLWLGHNSPNRSIIFATDETEKMSITPAGDVLLGKNTAVSNQLNRELNIYSTGQFNGIVIQNSTTGTGRKGFAIFNNNLNGCIHTWGAGSLSFGTNDREQMIITAGGRVGIGLTPDPSALLDVASTVQAVTPGPIASSSHGAFRIKADATDSQGVLQFVNNAGDVQKAFIRVTSSGEMILHAGDNIIISPTGVYTDGATGNSKGQGTINAKGLYVNGVAVTAGPAYVATYPVTPAQTWTYADPGGQSTYFWGTNDGNLMRPYQTATLSVAYAAMANRADSATNATNASYATRAGIANSTEPSANFQMNSLGVGCGPAGTTGTIYTTNNIVAFYSDQRLKKDIELITDPLSKVLSLRGVTYTQNLTAEQYGYTNYESQVGVIAQDVQAVLPEAVKLAPFDTDADGSSKSGENYMTVQYEKIVPLLIEAIKELTAKVAVLEEKLK